VFNSTDEGDSSTPVHARVKQFRKEEILELGLQASSISVILEEQEECDDSVEKPALRNPFLIGPISSAGGGDDG
ncbi:MAG: hypothetical protein ACWGQW_18345, partial [bacterium]